MGRSEVAPPPVWWLGIAVFVVLGALAIGVAAADGERGFYRGADSRFFRDVAEAPFGDGATVDEGGPAEAAYRYGRVGLPLVAWVTAAGQTDATPWTLVLVNIAALASIPVLAAAYLRRLGRNPWYGALVLLAPGLWLVGTRPYAEPLAIALVLAAFGLDLDGKRAWAIAALACAILTREAAVVALVPFVVRDYRVAWKWFLALVPYAAWATWVRWRVGEIPFLADVSTRRDALRPPVVGFVDAWDARGSNVRIAILVAAVTVVIAVIAGWQARVVIAGGAALAAAVVVACAGPLTLRYAGEALRVLSFAQVLTLVCIAYLWGPSEVRNPHPAHDS